MADYTYENVRTGEIREFTMSLAEMEELHARHGGLGADVEIDGEWWHKCCAYDQRPEPGRKSKIRKEIVHGWTSENLGEHSPAAIARHKEEARRRGISLEFDRRGRVVCEGPDWKRQRNAALEYFGVGDRDAGYGDRAPEPPKRAEEARPECLRNLREQTIRKLHAIRQGY